MQNGPLYDEAMSLHFNGAAQSIKARSCCGKIVRGFHRRLDVGREDASIHCFVTAIPIARLLFGMV